MFLAADLSLELGNQPKTNGILDNSSVKGVNHMSAQEKKYILVETIEFSGHPNILGTQRNTIEVTKVAEISRRADCIIGVRASKACADLSPNLRKHIQAGGELDFSIIVGDTCFAFSGRGQRELDLSDLHELVLRRSDFVSSRTAAIYCDAAAVDLPRKMIELLQDEHAVGTLIISAVDPRDSSGVITSPLFIES